jgi:nicotinic acid mononucleotide adenylyltransferase
MNRESSLPRPKYFIIPTTANPLHKGHLALYYGVEEIAQFEDLKGFEICKDHVSKTNMMPFDERRRQFTALQLPVMITENAPTFVSKAHYIRKNGDGYWKYNLVFCVGTDTFKRVYDKSVYADSDDMMEDIIYALKYKYFCEFLVFERNGVKLRDLTDVPEELMTISHSAERHDSIDISSTQLREQEDLNDAVFDIDVDDGFDEDEYKELVDIFDDEEENESLSALMAKTNEAQQKVEELLFTNPREPQKLSWLSRLFGN